VFPRFRTPDLLRGRFDTSWIYIVGPILGAMVAVCFEWILKGKPTTAGAIAAQGVLDEGND
jgi:aquaporin Z